MTKIKYLKPTSFVHAPLLKEMEDGFLRSGLYQWVDIFNGDIKQIGKIDDWEKYDVVHMNLSGGDWHQVHKIKSQLKNSSTKLIVNNDYGLHEWQTVFRCPEQFAREIQEADAFFSTEPYSRDAMQILLGKKVHLIPH